MVTTLAAPESAAARIRGRLASSARKLLSPERATGSYSARVDASAVRLAAAAVSVAWRAASSAVWGVRRPEPTQARVSDRSAARSPVSAPMLALVVWASVV